MVIQSILCFILGATTVSFLLILVAPTIWRRCLFLAKQNILKEIPFSIEDMENEQRSFLASHIKEISKLEKKYSALQTQFALQKVQLDSAKEKLYDLSDMKNRCKELEDLLSDSNDQLEIEKNLVLSIKSSLNQELTP